MESQKVQPDFFISHSKETKYKIAVPFMQALISLGFDVWLDRRGILVGERIYSKIEDVIKVSNYCIAIIDSSYLERTWTIKELQLFYEKEATAILPIFVNLKKEVVYNKIPWLDGAAFTLFDAGNCSFRHTKFFTEFFKCKTERISHILYAFTLRHIESPPLFF